MVWNGDMSLIPEDLDKCTMDTCPPTMSPLNYYPSKPFNTALLVLFAISTVAYLAVGIWKKTWGFMIAMVCGGILEIIGYVARVLAADDVFKALGGESFMVQIVCLTIAPAFYAAGIYLCLSRIVIAFGPEISRIKPKMYTYLFITFDIISLVLQSIGGAMAASAPDNDPSEAGENIMIAGLAWQVFTLTVFMILCGEFAYRCWKQRDQFDQTHAKLRASYKFRGFLLALAFATLFIYIRCVYRVAELSQGWNGSLITNETYFLVLEGLMVVLAVLILNVFHPGICFQESYAQKINWKGNVSSSSSMELKPSSYTGAGQA